MFPMRALRRNAIAPDSYESLAILAARGHLLDLARAQASNAICATEQQSQDGSHQLMQPTPVAVHMVADEPASMPMSPLRPENLHAPESPLHTFEDAGSFSFSDATISQTAHPPGTHDAANLRSTPSPTMAASTAFPTQHRRNAIVAVGPEASILYAFQLQHIGSVNSATNAAAGESPAPRNGSTASGGG